MAVIFLSHASVDKPMVRRIEKALRAAGHEPWLDENEIELGDSIPAAVESALRRSDFLLLCLSNASADRHWVEAERHATFMLQMRDGKSRLLPVRLEDVKPPFLLGPYAYVDAFPDDEAFDRAMKRIVRAIEKHLANRAASPTGAKATGSPVGGGAPGAGTSSAGAPSPAATAGAQPSGAPVPVNIAPSAPGTVDVFLSFTPQDASFAKELQTAVVLMSRQKLIRLLHRDQVAPGQNLNDLIAAQLGVSKLVALLVSQAYLASDCYERELERAMELRAQKKVAVVPILIRACEWEQTPLKGLVPLPRGGTPVEKWRLADEAWTQVARELRGTVRHMLGLPPESP
ncbi:MAG: toll/interleukin-1 receptor domain-containing protein [Polyangiaceae bacterium]|nr:toll/interleukin-1 receptor domain-containing protein [Polyangiaceae bacterium]